MRSVALSITVLVLATALGCTPARYNGIDDQHVAHGSSSPIDAWVAEPADGGMVTHHDAWVAPGDDAWVAPEPDAWTMPTCPTYSGDVRPLYVMHCANCHTTGGDPHFGSSYSVANQSSSSCGTSMAECTIELGQPGGSMARRDPYGGFSSSDIATIQAWIDCGRPM